MNLLQPPPNRIASSSSTSLFPSSFSSITLCLVITGGLGLLGCPPENTPLQSENQRLKKQIAKQESVIASLQEGNKVMQQQIDLLNQESRKVTQKLEEDLKAAEGKLQQLSQGHQEEDKKLEVLQAQNSKLSADAKWLRSQRDRMRKALTVELEGGKKEELSYPFSSVLKVMQAALTGNGYSVIASMQTDQKAVYVTERKTSQPASLEFSGFRNQYLLALEKGKQENTTLWVKADFEKISQNGHILKPGPQEVSEIELRLIQEIQRTLQKNSSPQKSPQPK